LRDAREARKWTTRELGDRISRNHGEISRWETGDRTPRPEYVAQVLTALGVTGDPYDEVMSLAYETNAALWVATSVPAQRQQLAALIELEQRATMIVQVSPLLVPGLLQTRDYARAIMGVGNLSSDEAVTRVAIRMGRRDIITGPNPVPLTAFIGDSVLNQIIGDRSVMFEQFRYLLEMAQRPNITVRLMPSDKGWHPGFGGPFIFVLPEDHVPVVYLELRRNATFLHEEDDVNAYKAALSAIGRVSLSPEASLQLIADRMETLS
jgi:transcriptional regulator with XRE-family HTH domain